ncbi:hypothetical protein [Methylovulum psychrotolerans]|uniref:CopG family transcriptional regulator n=1 Tax=Methylovulum psychrotolerans TaxID=1704499 RepID=A0A2S5CS69_9GAMM|nr:hypothetical protein [Methylovulum psychrotolerans]POZ53671.1 hypothetical protein AADEFJLK_00707 [Methylovulum psychrotolerans]
MMTLTIPDDVEQELKMMAENSQMTPSDFIVSLLQTAFKQQQANAGGSCFDVMQDGLGCIDDAPRDLSVNKRYLDGYGQ